MTRVELKRLDDEHFKVPLEPGETFLGRGPLLKIDATNISRKHAKLGIGGAAELELTCLHRNPIFVKKNDEWMELAKDNVIKLENQDEVKFLPNSFHFKIFVFSIKNSDDIEPCTETTSNEDEKCANEDLSPKPTGITVKRKRKLPNWMLECSPKKLKNSSPQESGKISQDNGKIVKDEDEYLKNVKLINPAWSSPKLKKDLDNDTQTVNATFNASLAGSSKTCERSPMRESPKKIQESLSPNNIEVGSTSTTSFSDLTDSIELIDDNEPEKENINLNMNKENTMLRPNCPYGSSCYRKNPVHRQEEAHPGDVDYKENNDEESDDDEKPECEFGTNCFRKNPLHKKQFKHTMKPQPKREAKARVAGKKKNKEDDTYDSDDSFINDEEDGWEPVDDSDDDKDWAPELSQPVDESDEEVDLAPDLSPEYK